MINVSSDLLWKFMTFRSEKLPLVSKHNILSTDHLHILKMIKFLENQLRFFSMNIRIIYKDSSSIKLSLAEIFHNDATLIYCFNLIQHWLNTSCLLGCYWIGHQDQASSPTVLHNWSISSNTRLFQTHHRSYHNLFKTHI